MQKETTTQSPQTVHIQQQQQIGGNKQIRILVCQINPFHKSAKNTIDRVERSLKKYDSKSQIDLVMFPEMAFVGYNFSSVEDALPYANHQMQGEEFQFAIEQAKRLKSYVGFGYIEKVTNGQQIDLYNSVAILDRMGKLHCNYRKSFLYFNDKLWAKEGAGFVVTEIKNLKGEVFRCVPAICMDINPKDFTSGQYELADFMLQTQAEVLLHFTNWTDGQSQKLQSSHIKATYNYWLNRMMPLIQQGKTQRLLVFCDRVGSQMDVITKKKAQFYGSSCGLMLNPTYMIQNLGIQNEGYLMIQTKLPKIELNKEELKK